MRLILSRKGFDSASGGVPSPVFPDGRMLSLPIPDKYSPTRYQDIKWDEYDLGKVVSDLTGGRTSSSHCAHLDPDLEFTSLPRLENWMPALGQTSAAQGHLRNRGVCPGDIFLFFGLFREIDDRSGRLSWIKNARRLHVIWGWLQVSEMVAVDCCDRSHYSWAFLHPHFNRPPDKNNTLYIATENLDLGIPKDVRPGAGVFREFSERLQLTDQDCDAPGQWNLPAWLYPDNGKPPLSYHSDLRRWEKARQCARLKTVNRGQEFVLDCDYYPEVVEWLRGILDST